MYKELIVKLESEISTLDGILSKVRVNKENIDNIIFLARIDSNEKRDIYYNINNKLKKLRKKYNHKADMINDLIDLGFKSILLVSILTMLRYSMMSSIPFILNLILSCTGIVAIAKLGEFAFNYIATCIEIKYAKKCENSEEFKELINQLDLADKDWSKANQKVERKEKILKWYTNVEKDLISRRNTKKSFLSYLENQTTPKTTTIHKSKNRVFKKVNKQNDALLDS